MGHDPGTRYLFHFNDHLNTDYVHEAPGVTMGPDISDYSVWTLIELFSFSN